jgi:hypothetical protein
LHDFHGKGQNHYRAVLPVSGTAGYSVFGGICFLTVWEPAAVDMSTFSTLAVFVCVSTDADT